MIPYDVEACAWPKDKTDKAREERGKWKFDEVSVGVRIKNAKISQKRFAKFDKGCYIKKRCKEQVRV